MGKITFYCNICAGPLANWDLRKRSMLQPGDLEQIAFDDECECEYGSGVANDEEDEDEENAEEGEGGGGG
ncbi:hypothetical protein BJX63DRAFT_382656, partial [Aspergillus granulosus]